MPVGSKLITKEMQWHAGMTELNHLGMALMTKPTLLSGTMDKLFTSKNYFSDNPLTQSLMAIPHGTEEIETVSWEWEMKGANTRPLVITEDSTSQSAVNNYGAPNLCGKNKTTFKLILDENWYVPGDILSPGTSDKKYLCRVQDNVVRRGHSWEYTVRLMSDNDYDFVPDSLLEVGKLWSKLFSKYEEASVQSGSTQYSTPIGLENRMGKLRKHYKVTDLASTEVLRVAIQDSHGNYHTSWMRYAEVETWQQWYRELERDLWLSRSTNTVIGANGRPVLSGPGVQEQLEDSHICRYSHLTVKLIEEYLMDIYYGRVKPGRGRNVHGYTGEYGMLMFHRAVQDWMQKSGFVQNVAVFTRNVKSDLNPNSLAAGYQFVRYDMANGCSLTLHHLPLYDDRDINFELDPVTGYPLESQRITFLDFSGEGGQSNVKIMNKKNSFAFTYVNGMFGPLGPAKGGSSAHAGDFYEMHMEKMQGLHIKDVTKCGELILSRN